MNVVQAAEFVNLLRAAYPSNVDAEPLSAQLKPGPVSPDEWEAYKA